MTLPRLPGVTSILLALSLAGFGSSALGQTVISGLYTGATITGDIAVAASTSATFTSGTTFTGAAATLATNSGIYWQQVGTLSGKTITLGNGAWLYVSSANSALTLSSTTTVTGDASVYSDGSAGTAITNQGTITHTVGNGDLYARTFTNSGTITASTGSLRIGDSSAGYNTFNSGTITATGASTIMYLDGNVANTGTVRSENGAELRLRGTNTTANLGTIQLATGGRATLNGTINNAAATLNAPTGGAFELLGGRITGGTIAAGALAFTGSGGYFDGATLTGALTLPASTHLYFQNGAGFTGTTATFGNNSGVYWQQVGTLSGKTLTQGSGSYWYVSNANSALTLAAGTTVTGTARVYSDGSAGTTITNQGTISHTTGNGQLYARTLTNSGTITATDGTLSVGDSSASYQTANSGTITANGASTTVYLEGNLANTGTLRAENSGELRFRGTHTSANLGTVQLATGGRATLNGTITNSAATLLAPTGGSYELLGGRITGGTIAAGALIFTSSGGYLDGATFTGNLNLSASTHVYFQNGGGFTGSTASFAGSSGVYWQQTGTLSGKALTLASGAYLYVSSTNSALTLDATSSVTGDVSVYSDGSAGTAITNQGTMTHTVGNGDLYARTFINSGTITANAGSLVIGSTSASYNTANSGTITANGSSTTVYLDGSFSNSGTLRSENGAELRFRGTNATPSLGTIQLATGGRVTLNGTLNNGDATLNAPSGGAFELFGGTITGGNIAAGALTFTSSGGYLDATTLSGNLTLPGSTHVRFTNGGTFSGSTATLGGSSGVFWQQVGTLNAKSLTLAGGSYFQVNGTNNALTLAPSTTMTGDITLYTDGNNGTSITNQGTITHTGGNGNIYGRTVTNSGTITANAGSLVVGSSSTNYNTANSGTITANGGSTTLYLDGNVTNTGTLRSENGAELRFRGTNTTANLGTVQVSTGGRVTLNGELNNASATLNAPAGGVFELLGGTITGGTVANGALAFTSSGGYLDNATLSSNLVLPASAHVRLINGGTFSGATATLGASSGLFWQQVGSLSGKTITFAGGSYLNVSGTNNSLTLAPSTTLTGDVTLYTDGSNGTTITNQGTITHTGGNGNIYGRTVTNSGTITASAGSLVVGNTNTNYNTANSGTITANGTSTTVYVDGNVTNTGTLRAENGAELRLRGTNTTANLGTIQLSTGGRVTLNGELNNTSATLNAPTGGFYELLGGRIIGGLIAPNALSLTSSGGTIEGATVQGNFGTPAGTHAVVTGGSTFTGTNAALGDNSFLYWRQNGTLDGKTITFGANSYLYVDQTNNALTLGSGTTATGQVRIYTDGSNGTAITNQGAITHTGGSGILYARNFANSGSILASGGQLQLGTTTSSYLTANSGTVTASGASTIIYLDGAVANTGTLRAENSGSLHFRGTTTTASLGTVQVATGGHAYLTGTLDNSSATLPAPSGGSFELRAGTINGGNIAPGALTFTSFGGTLSGVNLQGDIALPPSSSVYLTNNVLLPGANLTLGSGSIVYWQQSGSLANKTLTLGNDSLFYLTGANRALTLEATTTVTGDVSLYSDGSTGGSITNQGSITHTNGGSGNIYAPTVTNSGSIVATAGSLILGSTSTGTTFSNNSGGVLRVTGGAVMHLSLPGTTQLNNAGLIDVQGGTIYTGNHLTNAAGGTLRGGGTMWGDVTFAGGTLAPGNSIGTLTIQSGSLAVTGAGVFAAEIGGTTSDQLLFQSPTSTINLGSGLLTLSLTLLSAPVEATTYDLIRIGSGGNGITGAFANLPTTGSSLNATFGDATYSFAVNYQPNLVSLTVTAVPEPSTYMLLGFGAALLAFTRRRRKG